MVITEIKELVFLSALLRQYHVFIPYDCRALFPVAVSCITVNFHIP